MELLLLQAQSLQCNIPFKQGILFVCQNKNQYCVCIVIHGYNEYDCILLWH